MTRIVVSMLSLLATAPVLAAECPVEAQRAPTLRAIRAAPGCAESLRIMQSCAWGSSQDVEFAEVVVKRCEKEFPADMSAAKRAAYARDKANCRRKYANEHGTMYVSFTAHCMAEAAAKYAK